MLFISPEAKSPFPGHTTPSLRDSLVGECPQIVFAPTAPAAPAEALELFMTPGAGGGSQNWRVKTEDFVVMCMAKKAV